jgi:hypothetical protein
MSDEINIRQSGRHGRQWGTLDDEGNFVPYELVPLTKLPINWGVICFWGALLLVATVALVKLFAEGV